MLAYLQEHATDIIIIIGIVIFMLMNDAEVDDDISEG